MYGGGLTLTKFIRLLRMLEGKGVVKTVKIKNQRYLTYIDTSEVNRVTILMNKYLDMLA